MFGGNCPKCSKLIHSIEVEPVAGKVNNVENFRCFLHKCPECNTVISVQINPIEIQQHIIYTIGEKIKDNQPKTPKPPLNLTKP